MGNNLRYSYFSLLTLRAFLDSEGMGLILALQWSGIVENDKSIFPFKSHYLVGISSGNRPVNPDIEIILLCICNLQGKILAFKSEADISTCPVEGNFIAADKGAADICDPTVRSRCYKIDLGFLSGIKAQANKS